MPKILIILFLMTNFAYAQVDIELPELGDRVSGAISEAEVELLSEQFLQQVYSQAALIVDPIIQEYSELLLYRLSETSLVAERDFTVILIEQVTEPPEPERKITNIFSPGTQINYCPSEETSNLISIYIDTVKDLKRYQDTVCIGLSVIDLTTGKSIVYECYSDKDDMNKAYDEVFRFIQSHNPREIVFNIKSIQKLRNSY